MFTGETSKSKEASLLAGGPAGLAKGLRLGKCKRAQKGGSPKPHCSKGGGGGSQGDSRPGHGGGEATLTLTKMGRKKKIQ